MNSDDKKLKTIAVALFDKDRLTMVRFYLDGIRPSDIARYLVYERTYVRSMIQRSLQTLDIDMIKNDEVLKKLMELKEVYDSKCRICLLCKRRVNYVDILKHLMSEHKDHLQKILNEVLRT